MKKPVRDQFVLELTELLAKYHLSNGKQLFNVLKLHEDENRPMALKEAAKPEIIRLYNEGYSIPEIREKINGAYKSSFSIRKVLVDAGVELKGHQSKHRDEVFNKIYELYDGGKTPKQIFIELKLMNVNYVWFALSKRNK